jgi:hypothetical protein
MIELDEFIDSPVILSDPGFATEPAAGSQAEAPGDPSEV